MMSSIYFANPGTRYVNKQHKIRVRIFQSDSRGQVKRAVSARRPPLYFSNYNRLHKAYIVCRRAIYLPTYARRAITERDAISADNSNAAPCIIASVSDIFGSSIILSSILNSQAEILLPDYFVDTEIIVIAQKKKTICRHSRKLRLIT